MTKEANTQESNNKESIPEFTETSEETGLYRNLQGWSNQFVYWVGIAFAIFELITLIWKPIDPYYMRSVHLFFALILIFSLVPFRRSSATNKIAWSDYLFIIMNAVVLGYLLIEFKELIYRITTTPTTMDVIISLLLVILVLESARRLQGWSLPIIAIIFIVYALAGNFLPGLLWHKGYDLDRTLGFIFSTNGILGIPLGVSATYVYIFILFGAFLQVSGASKVIIDFSLALAGGRRGGPAKVAVISSALFGTISGSSVGNVVTTGTFTIPLIKRTGYSARFAGAVEAVASTGGQIMPPIMGAGAFMMAEFLGIPYLSVALAATIPALLYFWSVFVMTDYEAVKRGLVGLPKEMLPDFKKLLLKETYLLTPILVLLFALFVLQITPLKASFYAMISILIISAFRIATRFNLRKILEALYLGSRGAMDIAATTAVAGIIVGIISLTGLGTRFSMIIISYSNGNLLLGLILAMIITIVLGMGLPTVAAYAIAASVVAPGLVELGANPIGAHLFILYFAGLSAITPPVALASFAGAAIARAKPMDVAFTSMKLAIAAYIIPFMFVYGPSLLMQGSMFDVLLTLVTSLIGVIAFSGAVQGWFIQKASVMIRAMLLIVGLLLIKPGLITDFLGLALLILVIIIQKGTGKFAQKRNMESTINSE